MKKDHHLMVLLANFGVLPDYFPFKELLKTVHDMNMEEQEAFLEYAFHNWKQDQEQTDDVLVIGLRV